MRKKIAKIKNGQIRLKTSKNGKKQKTIRTADKGTRKFADTNNQKK